VLHRIRVEKSSSFGKADEGQVASGDNWRLPRRIDLEIKIGNLLIRV